VIGVSGSVAAGRLLARQLFGVRAWDLPTYAAGVIAIVGIALVAAYGPARRAAAVAPMTALRSE
jgi:ABC-type antimicrobial peptide transport system permease subunit